MKVTVCDVCLTEGKIVKAGWRSRLRLGVETLRLSICTAHKEIKMGKEKMLEIGRKAEVSFFGMGG